jgi:Spy/CpxP family protein refolding chaperone
LLLSRAGVQRPNEQEEQAMKMRGIFVIGLVLLVAGALPASAQMMGGGSEMRGMADMMGRGTEGPAATGCPGMTGEPVAFGDEGPWISFALAHARELELTADQLRGLTAVRDEFQKEAIRLAAEVRTAEAELRQIYRRKPVDLQAAEAKIRAIAGMEADLRLGRVKALEKGQALLTPEQQQKLSGWRVRGAFLMGGPWEFTR